jgi:PKD repeat protein
MDIKAISLMWNGAAGEYALVYTDAPSGLGVFPTDTRLRRMTQAGNSITDTEFSPDVTKYDYATRYPVIFNGSSFVGGIDRFKSNAEGSDAYLVRHCPLTLSMRADQGSNVPVGTNVTLRATTFGGFGNYSYFWDFGDFNSTPGPAVITHKYDRLGTYTASVTVTDAQGSRQTASFTIVVSRPKPRIAKH